MDYSLLLGIHDTQVRKTNVNISWHLILYTNVRGEYLFNLLPQSVVPTPDMTLPQLAEDEDRETEDDLDEEDEEYDSGGSGVAMTPPGELESEGVDARTRRLRSRPTPNPKC